MPTTSAGPQLAPGGLPLLGHVLPLARHRQRFMEDVRSCGDVAEVRLGPKRAYIVNSPELLRRILVTEVGSTERGRIFEKVRQLLGNGIATSDGAFHLRQRRALQPAFHRDRYPHYAELIRDVAQEKADVWRPGQHLRVDREMQQLTLDVIMRTLFSTHLSHADAAVIHRTLPILINGAMWRTLLPVDGLDRLPIPANRRVADAQRDLVRVLDGVIAAYRHDGLDHRDLLSILTMARNSDSMNAMTDSEVRDEAMQIMVAGSDTTGHVFTALYYELGRNPAVEERMYAEIDAVVGDRPVEYGDVARLEYTNRVVKETLRLHTPLWLLMKRTTQPVTLGDDFTVPTGTDLLFSPRALHRDPALYPHPLTFDPDRWEAEQTLPREAFIPFLTGVHRCIGEFFALMEIPLAVATIARRWRLRPVPGQPVRVVADLLAHIDTLPMVATPR